MRSGRPSSISDSSGEDDNLVIARSPMIRDLVGVIGLALIICGAVPLARQELRIYRRRAPFDVNKASIFMLRFSLPVVIGSGIAVWAYNDLGLWGRSPVPSCSS